MDATLTCRKPLGIAFRQRAESERMVGLSRVLHTAGAVLTVHFSTRSCHATIYLWGTRPFAAILWGHKGLLLA